MYPANKLKLNKSLCIYGMLLLLIMINNVIMLSIFIHICILFFVVAVNLFLQMDHKRLMKRKELMLC